MFTTFGAGLQLRRLRQADVRGVPFQPRRDFGGLLDNRVHLFYLRCRRRPYFRSYWTASGNSRERAVHGHRSRADLADQSFVAELSHLRHWRRDRSRLRIRADGCGCQRMVRAPAQHGARNRGFGHRLRHYRGRAAGREVHPALRMARHVCIVRRAERLAAAARCGAGEAAADRARQERTHHRRGASHAGLHAALRVVVSVFGAAFRAVRVFTRLRARPRG